MTDDIPSAEEFLDGVPEVHCPSCGGDPEVDMDTKRQLADLGYLHGDVNMRCEDCGHTWSHGAPVDDGTSPLAELLECHACSNGPMLVHRITYNRELVREGRDGEHLFTLHLKCPSCKFFRKIKRITDDDGICLLGYPSITGSIDDATPRGWTEDELDRVVDEEYDRISRASTGSL